jgi:hypothetical protein
MSSSAGILLDTGFTCIDWRQSLVDQELAMVAPPYSGRTVKREKKFLGNLSSLLTRAKEMMLHQTVQP